MGRPLTARQQQVYDYIRDCISSRGYGPTVREIGEFIGIKSPNGVVCHLKALEKKNMILRVANKSRAIELVEPLDSPNLMVRGVIEDGVFRSFDAPATSNVLNAFHHPERFLLFYRGFDLGHRSILNGDILLLQPNLDGTAGGLELIETSNKTVEIRTPQAQNSPSLDPSSTNVIGYVVGVIRLMTDLVTTHIHSPHSQPAVSHLPAKTGVEPEQSELRRQ